VVHPEPLPKMLFILIPFEQEGGTPPLTLAEELLQALGTLGASVGVDPLTGGVEIRIAYSPAYIEIVRTFLRERNAAFDISAL
jgi:hypothetical protein